MQKSLILAGFIIEDLNKQIKNDADVGERQLTYYLELCNKDVICLPSFLYMHYKTVLCCVLSLVLKHFLGPLSI
jgi:hypothetical protein